MKQPIIVSIASMLVAACGGGEGDAAEDIGREALSQSTTGFRPAAPLATRVARHGDRGTVAGEHRRRGGVEGSSAEEYIRGSIVDSSDYFVDGFLDG